MKNSSIDKQVFNFKCLQYEIVWNRYELKKHPTFWLIINVIYNLIIALALIGVAGNCWKLQTGYKRFVQWQTTNEIKEVYMKAR